MKLKIYDGIEIIQPKATLTNLALSERTKIDILKATLKEIMEIEEKIRMLEVIKNDSVQRDIFKRDIPKWESKVAELPEWVDTYERQIELLDVTTIRKWNQKEFDIRAKHKLEDFQFDLDNENKE